MTISWEDLNLKLNSFLGDSLSAKGGYQYPLPLRINGWNFAQEVFSVHTLRECSVSPLVVEPDGRTVTLPADFHTVGMVYERSHYLQTYVQRRFTPGATRYTNLDMNFAFWLWGGKMIFDINVASTTLYMDYFAKWPKIEYSTNAEGVVVAAGEALVPEWAEWPLINLTAAYCLQPAAIKAAKTRNSNINIDSGQPEDNSLRTEAHDLLWMYDYLISKYPAQIRVYGEN